MEKFYTNLKCRRCGKEIILITGEMEDTKRYGNYISCPHCGAKSVIKIKEFDSIKECMNHNSYKRINGALRQVKDEW